MKPITYLFVLGLVTSIMSCACDVRSEEYVQETVISEKKIRIKDGPTICVVVNPKNQCGMAVKCEDWKTERPFEQLRNVLRIGDKPVISIVIPGDPCQTFIVDDGVPGNTTYYCSGGKCYPY